MMLQSLYTSQFERTRQTAAPLAERLDVRPVVVPYDFALDRDVDYLHWTLAAGGDDAVLVVGHDDKIIKLLSRFGHAHVKRQDVSYGELFLLVSKGGDWELKPTVRFTVRE